MIIHINNTKLLQFDASFQVQTMIPVCRQILKLSAGSWQ